MSEQEIMIIGYDAIGIFLGPVASIVFTPIALLLRAIFFLPFMRKSLLEKAKKEGHVITAYYKKSHTMRKEHPTLGYIDTMQEMGTYTYEVKGRTYKYRLVSCNRLPEKITLYYIKKPRKATGAGCLGISEPPWLAYYFIISLIIAIATVVMGMIIG